MVTYYVKVSGATQATKKHELYVDVFELPESVRIYISVEIWMVDLSFNHW